MKVEDRSESPRAERREAFSAHLPKGAAPAKRPARAQVAGPQNPKAIAARAKDAVRAARKLGEVRRGHDARAEGLVSERSTALRDRAELDLRVRDLLREELRAHPRAAAENPQEPPRERAEAQPEAQAASGAAAPGPQAESGTAREARVEAMLALAERIELFLHASRPALSMRVGGALQAEVQIERTGARKVALSIHGGGRVSRGDLAALRRELEARGLELSRLEIR